MRCADAARGVALCVLLLIPPAVAGCGGERDAPAGPPERILLVVVDTLRADAPGFAGGDADTPHMDALARRGRVARRAVGSFHATTMSMGALFSGRTPSLESGDRAAPLSWTPDHWCGLVRFAEPGSGPRECVPRTLQTLGEKMHDAGYWTIGVPSNALLFRPYGFDQGFDDWREVGAVGGLEAFRLGRKALAERRNGRKVSATALAAVDERPRDRFFLYVHYMDAHDWETDYRAGVERADAALGVLLDGLAQRGLLDGTAIVFVADHGEALGEPHLLPTTRRHIGAPSFEPVLRVPLVVVGAPDVPLPPLVRSEDVHRLLVAIAGGHDAAPATFRPEELLVSERLYQTYRAGRFKSFWRRSDGAFHLVDLEDDPGERRDATDAHPDVAEGHRARIRELSRELAATDAERATLSEQDRLRLRVLGYLDQADGQPDAEVKGP